MTEYTLHLGDCLEVLPTLAANSVDAIVTDPPYGLGFMGKDWDHGVPGEHFWREALRVAKPGAHLLAFGGTRTFHRLAVAIENAGWEIRDTVMWVYGQGFPKSLNVGCICTGSVVPYNHEQGKQETKRNLHSMRNADVSTACDTSQGRGEVLQSGLSQQSAPIAGWSQLSTAETRAGQSSVEGRGDILAQTWQLQADQVCTLPSGVFANGASGRIHHGASSNNGASLGPDVDTNGSSSSHQPRSTRQPNRELGTIQQQRRTQAGGMAAVEVCPVCGKLKGREGWGTALKPAWEPIIVARKPLAGTVAANVLEHGTGGLNIDACRVEGAPPSVPQPTLGARERVTYGFGTGHGRNGEMSAATGRWPANLIHDGSEEVVGLFPRAAGASAPVRGSEQSTTGQNGILGHFNRVPGPFHCDSGSAARFFYCAKASKADRDAGCEGLPESRPHPSGNGFGETTMWNGENGDEAWKAKNPNLPRRNHHPTVKPTDLMRYLCRLVTPPNGVVLDPFMGSGSTGKAAMCERLRFIGVELSAEYVEIAKRRIDAAARQLRLNFDPLPAWADGVLEENTAYAVAA